MAESTVWLVAATPVGKSLYLRSSKRPGEPSKVPKEPEAMRLGLAVGAAGESCEVLGEAGPVAGLVAGLPP